MSESEQRSITTKTFSLPAFKYAALLMSIFLIILGSMSVYEGQLSAAEDRHQNLGLIIVATLMLLLSGLFLLMLVFVAKADTTLSFTRLYMALALIVFGIAVGCIALVCAVDAPNVEGRGTLLWIVGAVVVVAGVVGAILSALYIARSYGVPGLEKLPK